MYFKSNVRIKRKRVKTVVLDQMITLVAQILTKKKREEKERPGATECRRNDFAEFLSG